MSFILDALKKSESDRQQKTAPDISDVPTATRPSGTPRWLWIVSGLLAINLIVLLVVLLKPGAVATGASAPPEPATGTESVAASLDAPAAEPEPERSEAPRAEPEAADAPPVTADRAPASPVSAVADAAPAAARTAPVLREPATVAPDPPPTYLTFNDLRASGNLSLPDLHIDLHVYSDNPSERFVFINMNQYRENATLSEGPRLRQITTEGVILEYVGTTFLLPRE